MRIICWLKGIWYTFLRWFTSGFDEITVEGHAYTAVEGMMKGRARRNIAIGDIIYAENMDGLHTYLRCSVCKHETP